MHGKEDAHARQGNHHDCIIPWRTRTSRSIQQSRQPDTQNQRRRQIDLDDLAQPDTKQTKDAFRLFVKRIG